MRLEEEEAKLRAEIAELKAKYKNKILLKEQAIRLELGEENFKLKAELERTKHSLAEKLGELERLYKRLEEIEMLR